jgi:hypothetical protein
MTWVSGVHPERVESLGQRRRALACSLAIVTAFASRTAAAGDLVDLRWSSPPGCPQVGAVEEQIRAIVSNSAHVTPGLRADGEITRIASRYRLTLLVFDANGRRERVIESDSCTALAGAAAVALGLLLRGEKSGANSTAPVTGDARSTPSENTPTHTASSNADSSSTANANGSPAPSSTAKTPQASRDAAQKTESEPTPEPEPETSGEWSFVLRAPLGAVDAGPLPDPALSVGGGVGLRYGSWHLGTSLRVFASETVTVSNPPDVGATVDRLAIDVWGCRSWSIGRFELGPCLSLGIDRFAARGSGARVDARSQHFIALAPGAGVQGHFRIAEWLAFFVTAAAGIQTSRARLTIGNGIGDVERLGSTRLTAGFGTEWIF